MKNYNVLEVKVDNFGECGFCQTQEDEILQVSFELWSEWLHVMHRMGNKEWGGVFSVKDKVISDFKIPKQEVTSSECEFLEELGGEGILHSHHELGAFHSAQDDKQARNLYEYSVVISSKGYIAVKRVRLPCKGFGYVKVKLEIINAPEGCFEKITEKKVKLDEIDFLKAGKSEIKDVSFKNLLVDKEEAEVYECPCCHEQFYAEMMDGLEGCPFCNSEFYVDIV